MANEKRNEKLIWYNNNNNGIVPFAFALAK
jgi:hypothetical protein